MTKQRVALRTTRHGHSRRSSQRKTRIVRDSRVALVRTQVVTARNRRRRQTDSSVAVVIRHISDSRVDFRDAGDHVKAAVIVHVMSTHITTGIVVRYRSGRSRRQVRARGGHLQYCRLAHETPAWHARKAPVLVFPERRALRRCHCHRARITGSERRPGQGLLCPRHIRDRTEVRHCGCRRLPSDLAGGGRCSNMCRYRRPGHLQTLLASSNDDRNDGFAFSVGRTRASHDLCANGLGGVS